MLALVVLSVGLSACKKPDAQTSLDIYHENVSNITLSAGSYRVSILWQFHNSESFDQSFVLHETGPDGPHEYPMRVSDMVTPADRGTGGTTYEPVHVTTRTYSGGTYRYWLTMQNRTYSWLQQATLRFYAR